MHTLMFEILKVLKASFEQDTKISSYIGKIISAKHISWYIQMWTICRYFLIEVWLSYTDTLEIVHLVEGSE